MAANDSFERKLRTSGWRSGKEYKSGEAYGTEHRVRNLGVEEKVKVPSKAKPRSLTAEARYQRKVRDLNHRINMMEYFKGKGSLMWLFNPEKNQARLDKLRAKRNALTRGTE